MTMPSLRMMLCAAFALTVGAIGGIPTDTAARTLAAVRESGKIGLCAHPNSLPFASKTADPPGFQIELGRALAAELGVTLSPEWVLIAYQIPRTTCDLILDMVSQRDVALEFGIKLSKPYYRAGVGLAVRADSDVHSFSSLNEHTKVGVQVGSVAAMILDKRHIPISVFGFEDEMLAAVANHEIDAAAVTPLMAQYYNLRHKDAPVGIVQPDPGETELSWDVGVGIRRPDEALRHAIEDAMDKLVAKGTIAAIYGRYGVSLEPPR